MSDIAPVNGPVYERIEPLSPGFRAAQPHEGRARPSDRPSDRVDISDRARLLSKLAAMPEIRQELVDEVRRQIADGTYDTEDKLDQAIASLADDLEA